MKVHVIVTRVLTNPAKRNRPYKRICGKSLDRPITSKSGRCMPLASQLRRALHLRSRIWYHSPEIPHAVVQHAFGPSTRVDVELGVPQFVYVVS